MKQNFKFEVYYTGNNFTQKEEVDKFKNKFKDELNKIPEVNLVSVSKNPERAEVNNIMITPTILRVKPEPKIKIVGDFPHKEETWNKIIKEYKND